MEFPTLSRIRLLAPELANQIAAGEVVERPASVAKELVENSLDAGADDILVEVEQGGVQLLRVRDNGSGIHGEDLPLAVSRHATSKIVTHRDLIGIRSLGFRGEALASIASVSRFSLSSRTRDAQSGWQLNQNPESPPRPCAHPAGTTVEIRDLFYNVPARRKFLRAERTEYEHVEETLRRQALARFDVGFTLRHNGRQMFALRPAAGELGRERRLAALVGKVFLENALALHFEATGLRLHGWIGRAGYGRPQADVQYVYLNGRVIRDKLVSHAIRQSYEGIVETGRYPAYVLYLELDPAQVDVNVHPTKHEVRFRESRLVHDFLVTAVREALHCEPVKAENQPAAAPAFSPRPSYRGRAGGIREQTAFYTQAATAPDAPRAQWSPLGAFADRFLIAENKAELALIDLEQVARAQAVEALTAGSPSTCPLLFPLPVKVDARFAAAAEQCADTLAALGFDLNRVADDAVLVRGVPAVFAADAQGAVRTALAHAEGPRENLITALAAAVRPPATYDGRTLQESLAQALRFRGRPGLWLTLDPERLSRLIAEAG